MSGKWFVILAVIGLGFFAPGCHHTRDRNLRQDIAEEYIPVPDDKKFSDPPTYPDQKTKLPGPKTPASPSVPSMRGGPGGGGGGGMGGPGGAPY